MIDLTGGPCVYKRMSGCGSGTEYLAVTPWGDLYPCHQFVGQEEFLMGNVDEGITRPDIVDQFKCCNVYTKEKCQKCFARYYCSGGCAANSYHFHGTINDAYDIGCELQRKRVECAIMIKAALAGCRVAINKEKRRKTMNKKKATWTMVLMALFLVVVLVTASIGWGPTGTGSARNIKLGLDLSGGVSITYQAAGDEDPSAEDMSDTVYKLQQRVNSYSTEASVYQEGSNRINIEIPGASDANAILEELGKPGSLTFQLSDGTTVLDGSEVKSAEAGVQNDSMGNSEHVFSLTFTDEGTKAFADATSANVGNPIYIVYDGTVISAPTVKQAITDGKCVISGSFTAETASNLASSIRIGSLSLELEEIRSNVVGAQLGEEAISTSLTAGLIGLIIIIIFMIFVYKIPGLIAGISLVLYTGLELVALNAFDMTLTLSGIAGVILSIGMAVDANVIIYARIREEIGQGKTVRAAIDTGFKKALSAIIDGNYYHTDCRFCAEFHDHRFYQGICSDTGSWYCSLHVYCLRYLKTAGKRCLRPGHEG